MGYCTVVGYGELMMRYTPYHRGNLIEQSDALKISFAGAESNILANLSLFGHSTVFLSSLPNDPLGRSAKYYLNKHGIDTRYVKWKQGRLGNYFVEHGNSIRGTRVTYDRSNSSFSNSRVSEKDWNNVLKNTDFLVLTGITAALSKLCRQNIFVGLEVAKELDVNVVFDLNYRRKLFTKNEARNTFEKILPYVNILVANIGSARDVYEIEFEPIQDIESLKLATIESANKLADLGNFDSIAMTMRNQNNANNNDLGGVITEGNKYYLSDFVNIDVIDRLGGGDAFVSGMLHGLVNKWEKQKIVSFATAAFALTQTIEGDVNYFTEKELLDISKGKVFGHVKR